MTLGAYLTSVQERVDALTLRERLLLFAAIVVVTYTVIIMALIRPLEQQAGAVGARLAHVHAQTRILGTQVDAVLAPEAQAREAAELRSLRGRIAVLKRRLGRLTASLVPARDMPALLRRILARTPGVTLIALKDQGVVAVRRSPKARPLLYRHSFMLIVRGPYAALVRYLAAMAHTRKRILWGRVTLRANHYPFSTLTLHVYTLSTHEAFLQ